MTSQIIVDAISILNAATLSKDEYARDANGQRVHWLSPNATSFSMMGALMRAANVQSISIDNLIDHQQIFASIARAANRKSFRQIMQWNDAANTTKAQVIALLTASLNHLTG